MGRTSAAVVALLLGVSTTLEASAVAPHDGLVTDPLQIWSAILGWIEDGYQRAPAMMMGLGLLLAVPIGAAFGAVLRRHRRRPRNARADIGFPSSLPARAWIEIEGTPDARCSVERELLRIGREADNDLCLPHRTVQRYHAAIQRTPDAEFLIADLGGPRGSGVRVNGTRVACAHIASGDVIQIGEIGLKFVTVPA